METEKADRAFRPLWQRYDLMLALYAGVTIAVVAAISLPFARDYVGGDNDDVMRLVQVRDLLSGQGWFDLTQYRLGLEGGTLMHWSRLVDLPIAALILFFGLFVDPITAEALALSVWPLLLIVLLLAAMGLAGRRVGGVPAMHIAFGLTALLVLANNRFLPGAIDHHNLQLVLIAVLAAMLVDPRHGVLSFVIAGAAAAIATAIGIETMPLVVAACGIVAVTWVIAGDVFASAARAFALALAGVLFVLFFATTPPHLYAVVTCDSLSIGYFGLALVGGLLLFLSTFAARGRGISVRLAVLGADAVLIIATALILAPKCLRSPLADLDPMLVTHWLSRVTEARSILDVLRIEPGLLGGFYAAGVFAIGVCAFRLFRRDRVWLHATMLPLLVVAWGVAVAQVRGAVFANLLSIIPLSLLIAELRGNARGDPKNLKASLAFLAAALISVPSFWFVVGTMTAERAGGLASRMQNATQQGDPSEDCSSGTALAQLKELPPSTTIAAPSNIGADILRFTEHRVLSAPYHRNQGGMLAEIRLGLAKPEEAPGLLREAGVGLVAFCRTDAQTKYLIKTSPGGFYAVLAQGKAPPYLNALPKTENSGLQLYRVDLPRR
jgi:hypothetical protein